MSQGEEPENIRFAGSGRIMEHGTLTEDFMRRVLGLEPGEYILTDQSSLWDLASVGEESEEQEVIRWQRRIEEHYNVGTGDPREAIIADILDRIAAENPGWREHYRG